MFKTLSFSIQVRAEEIKVIYAFNCTHQNILDINCLLPFLLFSKYKTFSVLIYSYIKTFSVLTLSYIKTALSQFAFRIYKCMLCPMQHDFTHQGEGRRSKVESDYRPMCLVDRLRCIVPLLSCALLFYSVYIMPDNFTQQMQVLPLDELNLSHGQ